MSICIAALVFACGDDRKGGGPGKSYNFTVSSAARLKSTDVSSTARIGNPSTMFSSAPANCTDNVCFTPTALTGKYFGVGLMIQSGGNGMNAYFGQESWSGITAASTSYDFDFNTPITETGTLVCCTGTGDLSSENTYFSDAIYLFGYLDATFEVAADSGANGDAIGPHTVRFILADDAIESAKRGDLMYKDADTTFKWMDSTDSGTLSATRPTSPVTMNSSVVSWSNPYGDDKGNSTIPVISTLIAEPESGGVHQVSESELKTADRTYTYDFPVNGFIFFPTVLRSDIGMLSSKKELLSRIHLQGLPHTEYEMGSAGSTVLTISEP